jgi:hypothetical protein
MLAGFRGPSQMPDGLSFEQLKPEHHLDPDFRARTCFVTGWSGQQPRPTHLSSDNVRCGFTLSAIAVPVPAIMASATTQPVNIFMAPSSWAATLASSLAKSCDRHHQNVGLRGRGLSSRRGRALASCSTVGAIEARPARRAASAHRCGAFFRATLRRRRCGRKP